MKIKKFSEKPLDIHSRIGAKPIVCYPNNSIEDKNLSILHSAREYLVKKNEVIIITDDGDEFKPQKRRTTTTPFKAALANANTSKKSMMNI